MVAGRATGGATSTAAAGLTAKFKKAVEEGRSLIGDDQVLRALETRFPQFAETIGQIGELNLTAAEGVLIGKRLITEATCLAKMEAASAKSALDDLLAAGLAIKDARMAGLNLDRATVKGACAAFGSIALRTGLNAAAAAKQGAEAIRICNTGPEALSLVPGSACPVKK
jgi:hypothetical protein